MEQKDYFMRQIDQLGKALANVLASLLSKGYQGNVLDGMEMIDQTLKDNLNIDMLALSEKDDDSFIKFLLDDLKISPNNLEVLSKTMIVYGDSSKDKIKIYRKALILLRYIQDISVDYSFDRELKIKEIESAIQNS